LYFRESSETIQELENLSRTYRDELIELYFLETVPLTISSKTGLGWLLEPNEELEEIGLRELSIAEGFDLPSLFGSCSFVRESKMLIAGGLGKYAKQILQVHVNNHKIRLSKVGQLSDDFTFGRCFHDSGRTFFCFDYKFHRSCTVR